MEYTAKKILSCVGTNREVKVGDIIMLQQVATVLKISPSYAKELLLELERREFLSYEEGNEGKRIDVRSRFHRQLFFCFQRER